MKALQDFELAIYHILTVVFNFLDTATLMASAQVNAAWRDVAIFEWNCRLRRLNGWVDEARHGLFWTTIHNTEAVLIGSFVNGMLYPWLSTTPRDMLDIVVPRGQEQGMLQVLRDAGYDKESRRLDGIGFRNRKVQSTWILFNSTACRFHVLSAYIH